MKFFNTDGSKIDDVDEFISYYGNSYYIGEDRLVRGVSQSNRFVEDEIDRLLKEGIQSETDVVHILAWKVGKIKHSESDSKFEYAKDWKNAKRYEEDWANTEKFDVTLYKKRFDIKTIAEYIAGNIESLERKAEDNPQGVLYDLKNLEVDRIGPVYLITLLYFISKGKYPIYDRFAHIALKKIEDKEECSFYSLITDKELQGEFKADKQDVEKLFKSYQDNYVARLRNIFGKAYNARNVDRALWVYGHLFNDTKTNRKRIEPKKNKE